MAGSELSESGQFRLRRRLVPGERIDEIDVAFTEPFRQAPRVAVMADEDRRVIGAGVYRRSRTGCRIWIQRRNGGPATVHWCAVAE